MAGWMKKGHLTSEARDRMPSSEFALPGHGEGKSGKGSGSYPVNDEAHARAALSRGAQNASSSELAAIKRKVHSKYPDIKIGGKTAPERRYGKR